MTGGRISPMPGEKISVAHTILIKEYMEGIAPTDRLSNDLKPVQMGLFGEVGSIMTAAKKLHREREIYVAFRRTAGEEFGDAFWYFNALCRRLGYGTDEILSEVCNSGNYRKIVAASDVFHGPIAHISTSGESANEIDKILLQLGRAIEPILRIRRADSKTRQHLSKFADCYLQALEAVQITFAEVLHFNLKKARGRFLDPDYETLPTFDDMFLPEEQLPQCFEIKITQRKNRQSYLQLNGVFIGDPLTDNILDRDDYRFHDVFHFANAAILHWSPVFRALIKHKRNSQKDIDEAQDGGRAIVVEEGLTAWIFSVAKEQNFFENKSSVPFDLLKTASQFVSGYEVDECPLRLWEIAILSGYEVFRKVRDNSGGVVIGDRRARTINYRPL